MQQHDSTSATCLAPVKIERTQIEKITITGAYRLDPITVLLEDLGPTQGQITLSCHGRSWTAYFGGCGSKGIAHFISCVSTDYLADKMFHGNRTEIDLESFQEKAKREIIKMRRASWILTKAEARNLWNTITSYWPEEVRNVHDGRLPGDALSSIFGEEWWYETQDRATGDFTYLTRIVDAVREALAAQQDEKQPAEVAA